MMAPMNKGQRWLAYASLVFIALWSIWLLYMIGVYLFA